MNLAESFLERARATHEQLSKEQGVPLVMMNDLESYMNHAQRQVDQIRRRVLEGEKILHAEKVFSIFEPHTEWISKGKAGVPVELGLRVLSISGLEGIHYWCCGNTVVAVIGVLFI